MIRRQPTSPLFPYTTLFRSFPEMAKRPNVCTNLECYEAKWEASVAERVAEAKGKGRQVLEWKAAKARSEEHTSGLQSHSDLVCRLLLEKKKGRGAAVHCLVQ